MTDARRGYPPAMPFYQRLGDVPRKRHIQFRDNGTLLTEEVMGLEGFTGNESILYHLQSPCRVQEIGEFEPIVREEWVPDTHQHRMMHTKGVEPGGDEVTGRRLLMWNADVEISLCRPTEQMEYFFRNGEGDEVIFVHEGSGTLETIFGELPYKEGDYVVIPRGTTYRFRPEGEQRYLIFETPGLIEIPRRYRNQYGQIMEGAPYYHRDIHPPTELNTHRERGEFPIKVRVRDGYQTYLLDYHPFDVVGWDGYLYPWTFSIHDFEPITGRIHQPPPVAPDLRRAQLRDLLVLPAQARLRPARDSDPVSPLEPAERGDDLLRLRQLRLAEGRGRRLDHAASLGPAARSASRGSRRSRSGCTRRASSR